ncbi:MAG: cysteine desulfurase [Lachnospiraceae bacterium]|nr:cysteine desulfurase [Lachnospiraceae bacterium]
MFAMKTTVYLDNAATTQIYDEVLEEMMPFLKDEFASSLGQYAPGFYANAAVTLARAHIARLIGADPMEITFTSSGTESDNLFLRGVVAALKEKDEIVIAVNSTDHAAVLNTCEDLARQNDKVRLIKLPVDKDGYIDENAYAFALESHPDIISIMHVNNETGVVNDIKKLCRAAHEAGALFHTDAVQSVPHMRVDVKDLGVDALSVSGHKLHGPKGSGFLYVKRGVRVSPLITGGGQENGMRSGTLDVASSVGLGKACEMLFEKGLSDRSAGSAADAFLEHIKTLMPFAVINRPSVDTAQPYDKSPDKQPQNKRLYLREIISISIPGGSSLSFLPDLDMAGVYCSAGAACSAGKEGVSHVLKAMGMDEDLAKGTLRFSFSDQNTAEEATEAARRVSEVVLKNLKNHERGKI